MQNIESLFELVVAMFPSLTSVELWTLVLLAVSTSSKSLALFGWPNESLAQDELESSMDWASMNWIVELLSPFDTPSLSSITL